MDTVLIIVIVVVVIAVVAALLLGGKRKRDAKKDERRHEAAFDPEQERAFRANAAAWTWFAAQSPSYRTMATFWVVSAKRAETRARRLATLIECSASGRRVPSLAT